MPNPNKNLLLVISAPLNILPGHLQYHQTHSSTALNLNSYLKYEATIKTHRLQKSKNHMVIAVPPPNPSGSCTTTSSSDVRITYKMNTHLDSFPPDAVSFPTSRKKKYPPPSLSMLFPLSSRTSCSSYWIQRNPCPRNYHESYYLLHL